MNMYFSISDEMVSEFLSGLVVVLALVVVGCTIALVLGGMVKRFPFSRLALALALPPLCFMRFMEYQGTSSLHLYAMIVILMGITIDGINYLLEPKVRPNADETEDTQTEQQARNEESSSSVIVWEKAK